MVMICSGCKANLELSIHLSLRIMYGRLYVECPVCKYAQRCKISDKGEIILLDKEE